MLNPDRKYKALVIEDDASIIELLHIHLSDLGFHVTKANAGKKGLDLALNDSFDLIVLDIMLPEVDGIEICKSIRGKNILTPVIMLTSKSEELDKVLGLELGADEYMTKPFSIREFIARVKALFRRIDAEASKIQMDEPQQPLSFGTLIIDEEKRRVQLEDATVELTAKEYDLLLLFATHPGRTYSRQQLLDVVWGYQFVGYEHTVNSHINRLRAKIESDPATPHFIQTVWGVGYRFMDPDEVGK